MIFDKLFFKKKSFRKSPNNIVITCSHILEDGAPILYVKHDLDGDWQLLCGKDHTTEEARIISFEEVVKLDPSITMINR